MVENYGGIPRTECKCGSTEYHIYREGVSYTVECAQCDEPVGFIPLEKQIGYFDISNNE